MLNRIFRTTSAAIGLTATVAALPSSAQSWLNEPEPMTSSPSIFILATFGHQDISSEVEQPLDAAVLLPSDNVQTYGFLIQRAMEEAPAQYGFEFGAQLGLDQHHDLYPYRMDEQSYVDVDDIDSRLWSFDLTFGGFLSYRPIDWFRLYASAGAVGYWAHADEPGPGYPSENDGGLGLYQRAGFEFTLGRKVNFGLSVRKTNMKLDFGDYGELRLDEPDVQFTIGYHF